MTGPTVEDLERQIRGTYINVPSWVAGLCEVCSAPTTGPKYPRCVPCAGQAEQGYQLARGVIPLSWAPMAQVEGYSGQNYSDLLHYKEPDGTPMQQARLRALMWLAFTKHADCLIPEHRTRPFALTHVPSTSGLREGPHPIETNFLSLFDSSVPRVTTEYVGQIGGPRNDRRQLNPGAWQTDPATVEGVERVLIVDDTWVSGGHAQSVAAAFELAGIAARIVILGRALDPSRRDHGNFLRANPAAPFNSAVCPLHRTPHV